ncbi:plasmid mobilization protein [Longimycelium tulufanense]|nr:hypothetical protein [Longimycelium tulufanense]
MRGINVRFTDDELDRLRQRAKVEGRSLQSLIHDAALDAARRADHGDRVAQAIERVAAISQPLLKRLAEQ